VHKISPFALGGLLAICNTTFNAIALAMTAPVAHIHRVDVGVAVMFVSTLPAIVIGLCLGGLASRVATMRPWRRLLFLAPPAIAAVWTLGCLFESKDFIVVASIPTLVCVAILERGSRAGAELPIARIGSSKAYD
jgi:hypothetical protein